MSAISPVTPPSSQRGESPGRAHCMLSGGTWDVHYQLEQDSHQIVSFYEEPQSARSLYLVPHRLIQGWGVVSGCVCACTLS